VKKYSYSEFEKAADVIRKQIIVQPETGLILESAKLIGSKIIKISAEVLPRF
jgi:hypothetical protein